MDEISIVKKQVQKAEWTERGKNSITYHKESKGKSRRISKRKESNS